MSILLEIGRLVRAAPAPSALLQFSPSAEKEPAIKSATPAVGTIAAQFHERDCRHILHQEQLLITIHRPPPNCRAQSLIAPSCPAAPLKSRRPKPDFDCRMWLRGGAISDCALRR